MSAQSPAVAPERLKHETSFETTAVDEEDGSNPHRLSGNPVVMGHHILFATRGLSGLVAVYLVAFWCDDPPFWRPHLNAPHVRPHSRSFCLPARLRVRHIE